MDAKPELKMDAKFENITPDKAKKYLARNIENNRNIDQKWVNQLVRMMNRGEWIQNGEAIKFSRAGNKHVLIDGQHRLTAIIKRDKPLECLVIRNVPMDSMATIDTHKTRKAYHVLQMQGESNAPLLAASVRLLALWAQDHTFSSGHMASTVEILDTLEEHPNIRRSLKPGLTTRAIVPGSMAVWLHYLATPNMYEEVTEFLRKVGTGVGLFDGDPALALRERIFKYKAAHVRMRREFQLGMLVKAWNYYANGQSIKKLRYNPATEVFPRPVGVDRSEILGIDYPSLREEQKALDAVLEEEKAKRAAVKELREKKREQEQQRAAQGTIEDAEKLAAEAAS